jgi:hypothetical protein
MPLTGLPNPSATTAANFVGNVVLTVVVCGVVPAAGVIDPGAPTRFASEKLAPVVTPGAVAVTAKAPAAMFAVNATDVAMPEPLVIAVFTPPAKIPLAPLAGARNVTVTPLTGLPTESCTSAAKGNGNVVPTPVLCPDPLDTVIDAAPLLVRVKLAGVEAPGTLAVTLYVPAVPLAVNTGDVACPEAFVVAVFMPPANVPPAPLAGVLKVTVAPLTGLLDESVTVAIRALLNEVLMVALCPNPLVAVMKAGVPALLVNVKLAGVPTPVTVAATV